MREILSRQNNEIKAIAKLKTAKERANKNRFIAEGIRVCNAIAKKISPDTIYCTAPMLEKTKEIVKEEKIVIVSDAVMEKLSSAKTPSGILGVFNKPKTPDLTALHPGVVLARIADPGNMGALIRTAAAMGFESVVAIEGADPWSPKVVQASAGQIAHISLFQIDWHTLLENKKHLKLIALVVKNGKTPNELSFKDSLLVIGSEAHGIDAQWITECDALLTLPMPGDTESLNAAVAGSIALYLAAQ